MHSKEKFVKGTIVEKTLVVLLILAIAMVLGLFSNKNSSLAEENVSILEKNWYYLNDGERIDVILPEEITTADSTLILYNDGLTESETGLTISLKAALYDVKISYDDKVIYQYNDEKFPRNDQMKSNYSCDATLPFVLNDGVLKLEFFGGEDGIYHIPQVYIGEERAIILKEVKESLFPVGIALIMLALSAFAIGAGAYLKKIHVIDKRFVNAAFFLIYCSIWCITDSSILQQYSSNYHINSIISFCAFMLLAIPMLHFIRNTEYLGKYRTLYILSALFYINAIVQCVLNYLGYFEFIDMLFVTHLLLVIGCISVTVIILREYKINKTQEIQTIVFAFIVLAASGVLALILYWSLEIYFYSSIFEIGILIFVILLLRGIILSAASNLRAKTEIEVLRRLAKEDRLTGIGNRRAFEEYMNDLQTEAATLRDALLIFIDINFLKATNDRYGHSAGDELIIAASRCLKNTFGQYGEYFRIGGDEFCVILKNPSIGEDEWYEILDNEIQLYNYNSRCELSVAKGGSYLREKDGKIKTISDWKYQADRNMYEDKSRKRRK